jgi:hypothetical protein
VQRLAKFFTLTNAAITYPFVIFFLCTFWNVVFFCVVSQINVVTAAVQADNKLDLASLARLQRWWTAYLWRFRHFTFMSFVSLFEEEKDE